MLLYRSYKRINSEGQKAYYQSISEGKGPVESSGYDKRFILSMESENGMKIRDD